MCFSNIRMYHVFLNVKDITQLDLMNIKIAFCPKTSSVSTRFENEKKFGLLCHKKCRLEILRRKKVVLGADKHFH